MGDAFHRLDELSELHVADRAIFGHPASELGDDLRDALLMGLLVGEGCGLSSVSEDQILLSRRRLAVILRIEALKDAMEGLARRRAR